VPQGVLCKHVSHNNSWSWGVITHHCHRLHNISVQFFFPTTRRLLPRTEAAAPLPLLAASTVRRRRPSRRRPAGRTAGEAGDEPPAPLRLPLSIPHVESAFPVLLL
jgi:hypothetical protein